MTFQPWLKLADINGWTPLFWALDSHSPETVNTLLATGKVQIDRKDQEENTALMFAAKYGFLDVAMLLLSWKADLNIKNLEGHKAADVASSTERTEIRELLEAQREEDAKNDPER
ncbi:ankyrin [Ophiobolus disseminans]|uniref:Ankyrin n=1 Tax=Ophiobolus disseminans TaxID=1469910 RepID=A0A6A7AH99_9PLEO|nr:ankyrin [Ophiobolus disseminans]